MLCLINFFEVASRNELLQIYKLDKDGIKELLKLFLNYYSLILFISFKYSMN
ncbi:1-deoxy-D-xylulose-5-phosphate synthase, partial [Brachyspira hampsonii 30599]